MVDVPIKTEEIKDLAVLAEKLKTASTTEFLDLLLLGAISLNASDIHLEPEEQGFKIRFRVDGVLEEVTRGDLEVYQNLSSRIKFLSKMNINVKDIPQDGRFSKEIDGRHFDFRVSALPLIYGEGIVLRILEQEAKFYTLEELGFLKGMTEKIKEVIKKPYGLILNSGPTGCGKTTTLYAILNELNKPEVKIITLEDPIEYKLKGLAQSQIEPEVNFNFLEALKGALRSDPDILMVGEIRDTETASIALQAALTGHLVLSTFHANNAPSVLVRLVEMGIKPYLLSGSINLIIAQRLVRKICPKCQEEYQIQRILYDYLRKKLTGFKIPIRLKKGRGCSSCFKTGFKGRTAIGEYLIPTPKIEDLIIKKAPLSFITEKAKGKEGLSLEQDGLLKAISGITTIEEVFRVTRE